MDVIRPNQSQLPPHHVPNSVKLLLLAFALALVAGLGYLVWFQNNLPTDSSDEVILHPKKTIATTTKADAALNYVNATYGFSLALNDNWAGYKVKTVTPADDSATAYLYVNLPTSSTDELWTTEGTANFAGYASVMAISVFTPAQWTATYDGAPQQPTKLAEDDHYIFSYSSAQDIPTDLQAAFDDIASVIATFKLN